MLVNIQAQHPAKITTEDIKQTRNSAEEWHKNTAAIHKATPDHCMRTGRKCRTAMEQLSTDKSMAWCYNIYSDIGQGFTHITNICSKYS